MSAISPRRVLDNYYDKPVDRREARLGLILVAPTILLICFVILFPLIYNVYLSFTHVPLNPDKSPVWVGLENYLSLLNSSLFWSAFKTTVIYAVGVTLFSTLVGLVVAVVFDRHFRGRRLFRGLVLLPHVTPIIAVAFVWQFMLSPLWGAIPDLLASWGIYTSQIGVLERSATALPAVIIFGVWRNFPFAFLLIVARLQAIPESMYEAARIDGAGVLAQFRDITLPEIRGTIVIVVMLRFIWQFNTYTEVWLLTKKVITLPIFAYMTAFNNFELGVGAAISLLLFVIQVLFLLGYVIFVGEEEL